MKVTSNFNKKMATIYACLAITVIFGLLYYTMVFKKYRTEIDSKDDTIAAKTQELQQKKMDAAKAPERESILASMTDDLAAKVTVFYGEDEQERKIIYELGEIFADTNINAQNLTINRAEIKYETDNLQLLVPTSAMPSEGAEAEIEEEADKVDPNVPQITGEKIVKMEEETTEEETEPESYEVLGQRYDVNVSFNTGYYELRDFLSALEAQPKHILITNMQINTPLTVQPQGNEIVEYELDEEGVPEDYLRELDLQLNTASKFKDDNLLIMKYAVNMTITYLQPEFVAKYRPTPPFDTSGDEDIPLRGELEEDDYNIFMPVPWYDDINDEIMETAKKR